MGAVDQEISGVARQREMDIIMPMFWVVRCAGPNRAAMELVLTLTHKKGIGRSVDDVCEFDSANRIQDAVHFGLGMFVRTDRSDQPNVV